MRVDLVFLAFLTLAPLLHRKVRVFQPGLSAAMGTSMSAVRFGFVPADRELFTKTVVLSMALNVFSAARLGRRPCSFPLAFCPLCVANACCF